MMCVVSFLKHLSRAGVIKLSCLTRVVVLCAAGVLMGCELINVSDFSCRDVQLSLMFYIMKFNSELLLLKFTAPYFSICYTTVHDDSFRDVGSRAVYVRPVNLLLI